MSRTAMATCSTRLSFMLCSPAHPLPVRAGMFLRESGYYKTSYRADMALFPHPAVARIVWASLFLLFVPVPLFGDEHLLAVLTLNAINLVGALGLTILLGYAGQISLGHGAFMSVGAYTAANLAVRLDMPFWLTLPAGAAMAALIGIVVGLPSLRIRGFYLAIATLAAQLVIEWIINRTPAISGGIQASIHVPRPELFGLRLDSAAELYLFVMAVAVAGLLAALNLGRSRLGRAMVAVREHETAAALMGVDTARVKLAAFALSAAYGGVAGVLFTYYLGVANYQQYTFAISIYYLAVNIIGGLGSVWGALLGLAFLSLVPRFVFLAMTTAGAWFVDLAYMAQAVAQVRQMTFGVLILAFLVLEPEGLAALWRRARNRLRAWPFSY
ncbi:MAG: branched-chain amino acid ABC transporter permease [Alphaproteobacteria bacterium]|nr:branched-chain amino acid ABC transporter permease [Alphaproteobacteria bacterium]